MSSPALKAVAEPGLPALREAPDSSTCSAEACSRVRASSSEPVLPAAQQRWAALPIAGRLDVLRTARHWIAAHPQPFTAAISPALDRSRADTLVAELLPLLDAMRFLERRAAGILAPHRLGSRGRPLWLAGVQTVLYREPLGHVLVIGPANFPLFLPGVQVLQALTAGNSVTWKPGTGGSAVARLLAHVLREAGLPRGVLEVTDDTPEAGQQALEHGADKVFLTGSRHTGQAILRRLADTTTPAVLELSGADCVVVLPSADLTLVAQAVAFGLRLNGAEVCMSPRRLVATAETLRQLRPLLQADLGKIPPRHLPQITEDALQRLLREARQQGAERLPVHSLMPEARGAAGERTGAETMLPLLLDGVRPNMAIARTDLFAPVLSLLEAPSVLHMPAVVNDNPYGLTAAIFGDPEQAAPLAAQLRVGTVLINDLIAPTADPRVPFGGRRSSGFGSTRGDAGLLEMTAPKAVLTRRRGTSQHYQPVGDGEVPLFSAMVGLLHGGSMAARWRSLRQFVAAVRSRPRGTASPAP